MKKLNSIFIYNKRVHAVTDKEEFVNEIIKKKKILIAMNVKKVMIEDPKYIDLVNHNIAFPDGAPVASVINQKGLKTIKYPGHMLWLDILKKTHFDKKFYLIGATSDVVTDVVHKLEKMYPDMDIVNYRNGFFSGDDVEILKRDLQEKKPDIVFVAIEYPRQDYFMKELFDIHPALYVGLGGSFNVFTGRAKLVPTWWQETIKSEGIYRLLQDPKKIKRQKPALKFLYYKYFNKL